MKSSWILVWGALGALGMACSGSSSDGGTGGSSRNSGSSGSSGSAGTSGSAGSAGASGSAGSTSSDCPTDFFAAEGQPCSPEGKTCGGENCTDCGFCNTLMCTGGKWQRFEAHPGPDCADAGGTDCGGIAGLQCALDEYCDFDPTAGASCGGDDTLGVCKPRPEGCTADCPGVCGCDGQFYCNACTANAAGVDVSESATCSDAGI